MYTRFDPKTNFQAPVPCTYYVYLICICNMYNVSYMYNNMYVYAPCIVYTVSAFTIHYTSGFQQGFRGTLGLLSRGPASSKLEQRTNVYNKLIRYCFLYKTTKSQWNVSVGFPVPL